MRRRVNRCTYVDAGRGVGAGDGDDQDGGVAALGSCLDGELGGAAW